jgi:hypothetical protein
LAISLPCRPCAPATRSSSSSVISAPLQAPPPLPLRTTFHLLYSHRTACRLHQVWRSGLFCRRVCRSPSASPRLSTNAMPSAAYCPSEQLCPALLQHILHPKIGRVHMCPGRVAVSCLITEAVLKSTAFKPLCQCPLLSFSCSSQNGRQTQFVHYLFDCLRSAGAGSQRCRKCVSGERGWLVLKLPLPQQCHHVCIHLPFPLTSCPGARPLAPCDGTGLYAVFATDTVCRSNCDITTLRSYASPKLTCTNSPLRCSNPFH